jgi:hypothetical protein
MIWIFVAVGAMCAVSWLADHFFRMWDDNDTDSL